MRIGIVIWAFICSYTLINTINEIMAGKMDSAIIICACFLLGIYNFVYKMVEYIKEDNPTQIKINIEKLKKEETNGTEE